MVWQGGKAGKEFGEALAACEQSASKRKAKTFRKIERLADCLFNELEERAEMLAEQDEKEQRERELLEAVMHGKNKFTYNFPKFKSVDDKSLNWQGNKLAEETGEVCREINRFRYADDLVDPGFKSANLVLEILDVIQVCENILRMMGYNEETLEHAKEVHIEDCFKRDYIDLGEL